MELTLTLIITQMLFGLALGAVYILMACGLTIIFGLLDVVNFAHGTFYMLGAFAAFIIVSLFGNFWLGLASAMIIVGLIGWVTETYLIKPLYGKDPLYPLMLDFRIFRCGNRPDARDLRDHREDRPPSADFYRLADVGGNLYPQISGIHHLSDHGGFNIPLVFFQKNQLGDDHPGSHPGQPHGPDPRNQRAPDLDLWFCPGRGTGGSGRGGQFRHCRPCPIWGWR